MSPPAATIYLILVDADVPEAELNANGPVRVAVRRSGSETLISVCTDQSGLIGFLRYLHGLGFAILSVAREPNQ